MKAFILAAGGGERLKPLTDTKPKPLIKAGAHSLTEYPLPNSPPAGVTDVVINVAWLGEQIQSAIGDGSAYQLNVRYSDEGDSALETAGGIIKALPLLDDNPFLVVNADIWSDYNFMNLTQKSINSEAHLILVENPEHNNKGDFSLNQNLVSNSGEPMLTYSGIGIYTKAFFDGCSTGKQPLAPILRNKIDERLISGEHYLGQWTDVGTIERLMNLNTTLIQ